MVERYSRKGGLDQCLCVDACIYVSTGWTTWTSTWRAGCRPTAATSGSRFWRTATPWCRGRSRSIPSPSSRPPPSDTGNAPKLMVSGVLLSLSVCECVVCVCVHLCCCVCETVCYCVFWCDCAFVTVCVSMRQCLCVRERVCMQLCIWVIVCVRLWGYGRHCTFESLCACFSARLRVRNCLPLYLCICVTVQVSVCVCVHLYDSVCVCVCVCVCERERDCV